MYCPVFWRLAWKELRTHVSLWTALLAIALALQLGLRFYAQLLNARLFGSEGMVAIVFSIFFALGFSGIVFAIEHDTQTFEFLRALPIRARSVFLAKLSVGVVGTISLFAALMVVPIAVWRQDRFATSSWFHSFPLPPSVLAAEFALVLVELVAWGVLASLLCKNPIRAVVSGACCFLACRVLLAAAHPDRGFEGEFLLLRTTIVLAILLFDFALVKYWFIGDGALGLLIRSWFGAASSLALGRPGADRWGAGRWGAGRWGAGRSEAVLAATLGTSVVNDRPPRSVVMSRLLWQQWKECRGQWLTIACLAVISLLLISKRVETSPGLRLTPQESFSQYFVVVWIGALISICGASTFQADWRKEQFRFLAERGIQPSQIWFSRQAIWLLLGVALALLLLIVKPTALRMSSPLSAIARSTLGHDLLLGITFALSVFAFGQYWSLFIRVGLIGCTLSLLSAGFCLIWFQSMQQLDAPTWMLTSIPLVLFLSTYLSLNDWLVERASWRTKLRSLGLPIVSSILALAAFCFHRATEVPPISQELTSSFTPIAASESKLHQELGQLIDNSNVPATWFTFFNALPTARLGDTTKELQPFAVDGITPDSDQIAYLSKNQPVLELATRLALERQRRSGSVSTANVAGQNVAKQPGPSQRSIRFAASMLLLDARRLLAQGNLDESLDQLFRGMYVGRDSTDWVLSSELIALQLLRIWSNVPGQNPERLLRARQKLAELRRQPTLVVEHLSRRNDEVRNALEQESEFNDNDFPLPWGVSRSLFAKIPWERERMLRVHDHTSRAQLTLAMSVLMQLSNRQPFRTDLISTWDSIQLRNWQRTTLLPWWNERFDTRFNYPAYLIYSLESALRIADLRLCLAIWMMDHQELPSKLDALQSIDLSPDQQDPFSGAQFEYEPSGPYLWSFEAGTAESYRGKFYWIP